MTNRWDSKHDSWTLNANRISRHFYWCSKATLLTISRSAPCFTYVEYIGLYTNININAIGVLKSVLDVYRLQYSKVIEINSSTYKKVLCDLHQRFFLCVCSIGPLNTAILSFIFHFYGMTTCRVASNLHVKLLIYD